MNLSVTQTYGSHGEQPGYFAWTVQAHSASRWLGQPGLPNTGTSGRSFWPYSIPSDPGNCTSSGRMESTDFLFLGDEIVPTKTERLVECLSRADLKQNAADFLAELRRVLAMYGQVGADISLFPMLEASYPDDHSILFEWAYDDCRLGFEIEADSKQSYWYLMSTPESGSVRASGLIDSSDFVQWLQWLVFLLLLRS